MASQSFQDNSKVNGNWNHILFSTPPAPNLFNSNDKLDWVQSPKTLINLLLD